MFEFSSKVRTARIAFTVCIAAIVALSMLSYDRIERLVLSSDLLNKTHEVKLELQRTSNHLSNAEGSLNNFLLTKDSIYYHRLMDVEKQIRLSILKLEDLISDNAVQVRNTQKLDSLIRLRYTFMEKNLSSSDYSTHTGKIAAANIDIAETINEMTHIEDGLTVKHTYSKDRNALVTPVLLVGIQILIAIILVFAYRYTERELHENIKLRKELTETNVKLSHNYHEIKQQKEFIETIQNASFNMIAVYDKDGRFISFNKKCEEELNKKASEVIGKTFLEVWPHRRDSPVYQDLQNALKGQTVFNSNYQAVSDDRFFQSYTVPIFDETKALVCVVAIAHEITDIVLVSKKLEKANLALKQQNDFVETVLDCSVDVICVFDTDLNFLSFNNKAIEIFQMTPDMKGRKITECYPQVVDSKTHVALLDAVNGKPTLHLKHNSVVVNKSFESFVIPMMREGAVYAVMLIHHDITDLVAVNDKLIQKNKELERSNSELEQFAYVASHDLQEPLRKIRTYASLIETNINDSARVGSYLQKISSSAARMLNLIHDVLNYSRVRFNEDKFEVVDLNEVIRDIRSDFELMIEAKNARMLSSTLPQVFGSRTQLIQLFSNLIGNALKFSLEKPLIQISCQVRLDVFSPALNREADFYEITVNDNGIGFEPKFEEHIFEVFKRLHAQHEFGGNGIGLAICKRIVSNHQGLITAKSKPGEGSSFSILPPVKYQKSEQQVKIAVGESNV